MATCFHNKVRLVFRGTINRHSRRQWTAADQYFHNLNSFEIAPFSLAFSFPPFFTGVLVVRRTFAKTRKDVHDIVVKHEYLHAFVFLVSPFYTLRMIFSLSFFFSFTFSFPSFYSLLFPYSSIVVLYNHFLPAEASALSWRSFNF